MPVRNCGHRPATSLVAIVLVLVHIAVGPAVAAGAEPTGAYVPPVDAPVVDPWRPPGHAFGPGNRGVDYGSEPGDLVVSAGPGDVTFAGPVGGALHVVVRHADGVRTSYSFLASIAVRRGDHVARGVALGTAGGHLHFGVRIGEHYVDPALLWAMDPGHVHLVPSSADPGAEVDERGALRRLTAGLGGVGAATRAWLATGGGHLDEVGRALAGPIVARTLGAARAVAVVADPAAVAGGAVATLAASAAIVGYVRHLERQAALFEESQVDCTPPEVEPPPPPAGPRVAVLVAGFGSAGGDAGVLGLDTASLGYRPADVVQFSYRGGGVPGVGAMAGIPRSDYRPADSTGDIGVAGSRLRALLRRIGAARPGVAIDIIAHSQGGLVARHALGGPRRQPAGVDNLVTLGSPHDGADLATAGTRLRPTRTGRALRWTVHRASGGALDLDAPAAHQLAEGSRFLSTLDPAPPPTTRTTSIAARGDLVVPAVHSALRGATNVMLPLDGLDAHGELPSSPDAAREVALALAGAGPTCRDVGVATAVATAISILQDAGGMVAGVAAHVADGAPWPAALVPAGGPRAEGH